MCKVVDDDNASLLAAYLSSTLDVFECLKSLSDLFFIHTPGIRCDYDGQTVKKIELT